MNDSPVRVLCVDDEPEVCTVSKEMLEQLWDMQVDTAFSAAEAVHAIVSNRYDVIVSDYQMPETNGIELVRHIRSQGNHTPFILFTGKGREELLIKVLESGGDGYIQKGMDFRSVFAELAHKINNEVARTRAERSLQESEARYRSLVDNSTVGIFICDIKGDCVHANRKWLEMISLDEESVKGRGWTKGVHQDDLPHLDAQWQKMLISRGRANFEYRYVRGNNDVRWIWSDVTEVRDGDGRALGYMSTNVDVTEMKRAEEEQAERNKDFARASRMARIGHWTWKANETELTFSEGLAKMLGTASPFTLSSDQFIDMVHPDDREMVMETISRLTEHHKGFDLEHRMLRGDGSIIDVRNTAELIVQSGRPLHILGVVQDITGSKEINRSIMEKGRLHRIVFETMAGGIVVRDAQGKIVLCNDQAARMFGYPSAEALTINDVKEGRAINVDGTLCPRSDLPSQVTFRTGAATTGFISGILGDDQRTTWVSINTRPYLVDGVVQAVVVSISDVTSTIQSEQELRESDKRFKLIAENMSDVINVVDMDLNYIYVSPSVVKLTGFTAEEAQDRKITEVLTPGSLKVAYSVLAEELEIERAGNGAPDRVRYIELEEYRKDGSTVWVNSAVRSMRDENGRAVGLIVLSRDATESRAGLQALYEANNKLALLSRLTRHDIMNQLQVIGGWISLMHLDGERELEMQEKVLKALVNTKSLIEFTAEYEGLGSKTPSFKKVKDEVDRVAISFPAGSLRLENHLSNERIMADPLLPKAIYNLVENAVRHARGASYINFRSEVINGSLRIISEDDGPGIREEDKERIFQREVGQNTGEGLYFVRMILAITGMIIREEGGPGEGARFVITVPEGLWSY